MSKKSGKNIKLAVVGASGRMGSEIMALAGDAGFEVTAKLDKAKSWGVKAREVDIVVDFSLPAGFDQALNWCVENRKPFVSGTTGLSDKQRKQLKQAAKHIPILYSANMSVGIAVLSAMLEQFRALEDWDFHIDEVHHNQKKDRPSGTALLLDEKLGAVLDRKLPAPNSIRGGGVPGIHQVWAMGPEEVVVLQHTAFNRKVFARGALKAARWLFDKAKPGLYDLSDLYK
ncbi:MAG: 4-hydroxy-tetrahydrodipicolinate reductase [Bdellovibrionales bacterium]|nr:4-hydroxy-tetrahydrodipicolinate reductase [Bdellovibrionales bacterium]